MGSCHPCVPISRTQGLAPPQHTLVVPVSVTTLAVTQPMGSSVVGPVRAYVSVGAVSVWGPSMAVLVSAPTHSVWTPKIAR